MILSYSHRLKQWIRSCENHKKVKFLWSYLANNRLVNPCAKGIEIILARKKQNYINTNYYVGIKYINERIFCVKKYKVKIVKRYSFTLDGENKLDIQNQINTIVNHTSILDLPYVRKNVSVKIKELRKENVYEENN